MFSLRSYLQTHRVMNKVALCSRRSLRLGVDIGLFVFPLCTDRGQIRSPEGALRLALR